MPGDLRHNGPDRAVQLSSQELYNSVADKGHIARRDKTILVARVLEPGIQSAYWPALLHLVCEERDIEPLAVANGRAGHHKHIVTECLKTSDYMLNERTPS